MSEWKSKHIDVLAALLASVTFFAGMNAMADERDRFEARVFKDADDKALNYRLLKPKAYEAGKKYPMVVYIYEIMSNTHHTFSMPVYDDRPHMSTYADRKSTRLNSSHIPLSRMPSSA